MKVKEKVNTIIHLISDPKLDNVRKDVYNFLNEGNYKEIVRIETSDGKYNGVKWYCVEIEFIPREEND